MTTTLSPLRESGDNNSGLKDMLTVTVKRPEDFIN